jgi:hypothetical protein
MDGQQFDHLVQQVTQAHSRRGTLLGLVGGAVGLLGLGGAEAKHKKKKHKKGKPRPASPPPGPQCPASCPACQECVNGQSCTVQSDFTPCGNDGCNVCQGGACVNRVDGARCGENSRCRDGVCTPLPATCSDGRLNGDESEVDCGGTCDRCANGKTCTTRDDCDSARCAGGQCATCATTADCGRDAAGACGCTADGRCYAASSGQFVPKPAADLGLCVLCPGGTVTCERTLGTSDWVECYPRCGQTFTAH